MSMRMEENGINERHNHHRRAKEDIGIKSKREGKKWVWTLAKKEE